MFFVRPNILLFSINTDLMGETSLQLTILCGDKFPLFKFGWGRPPHRASLLSAAMLVRAMATFGLI